MIFFSGGGGGGGGGGGFFIKNKLNSEIFNDKKGYKQKCFCLWQLRIYSKEGFGLLEQFGQNILPFISFKAICWNLMQKQKVTSFSQQFQFSKRRSEMLMKNGLMINGVVSRSVIWFIKFTTNIPSRDPSQIFEQNDIFWHKAFQKNLCIVLKSPKTSLMSLIRGYWGIFCIKVIVSFSKRWIDKKVISHLLINLTC